MYTASRWPLGACNQLEERRFSGAILAKQGDAAARRKRETDVVGYDRLVAVAPEAFRKVGQSDHCVQLSDDLGWPQHRLRRLTSQGSRNPLTTTAVIHARETAKFGPVLVL